MANEDIDRGKTRIPTIEDLKAVCKHLKTIENLDLDGVVIPVANVDAMMKMKQGIRPRDREDLEFLKALKDKL